MSGLDRRRDKRLTKSRRRRIKPARPLFDILIVPAIAAALLLGTLFPPEVLLRQSDRQLLWASHDPGVDPPPEYPQLKYSFDTDFWIMRPRLKWMRESHFGDWYVEVTFRAYHKAILVIEAYEFGGKTFPEKRIEIPSEVKWLEGPKFKISGDSEFPVEVTAEAHIVYHVPSAYSGGGTYEEDPKKRPLTVEFFPPDDEEGPPDRGELDPPDDGEYFK